MARTRPRKPGKPFKRKVHIDGEAWTYRIPKNNNGVIVRSPDGLRTEHIPRDHFDLGRTWDYNWDNWSDSVIGFTPHLIKRYIQTVLLGGKRWDLQAEAKAHLDKGVPPEVKGPGVDTWFLYVRLRQTAPIRRLISLTTEPGQKFTIPDLHDALEAQPHVNPAAVSLTPRISFSSWGVQITRAVVDQMSRLLAAGWVEVEGGKVTPESKYVLLDRFREEHPTATMAFVPNNPAYMESTMFRDGYRFGGPASRCDAFYEPGPPHWKAIKVPSKRILLAVWPGCEEEFMDACSKKGFEPVVFQSVFYPENHWRHV